MRMCGIFHCVWLLALLSGVKSSPTKAPDTPVFSNQQNQTDLEVSIEQNQAPTVLSKGLRYVKATMGSESEAGTDDDVSLKLSGGVNGQTCKTGVLWEGGLYNSWSYGDVEEYKDTNQDFGDCGDFEVDGSPIGFTIVKPGNDGLKLVNMEFDIGGETYVWSGAAWWDPTHPVLLANCTAGFCHPDCLYKDGWDLEGSDLPASLGGGGLVTYTSAECIEECELRPSCHYWTFIKDNSTNCFLKMSGGELVQREGYLTGSKACGAPNNRRITTTAWNSSEECSEPCSSPRCEGLSKLMKHFLNLSVDPCNDFFAFSCNPNTRGTKAPKSPENGISMEKLIKSPPKGFEYVRKFFLSCTKVNTAFSTEEVFANCFENEKCNKKELKDYGNIFVQFLEYTQQFINRTNLPAVTPNWEQVTENLFGGQGWNWWDFAATELKDYFFLTAFQKIETENQDQETENSYDIFRSNIFFAPMIDTVLDYGGDDYFPTVHIVPISIPDTLRTGNESYLRKYKNIMKQILISFGADPLTVDNDVEKILNMELEVGKINPKKWFTTKYDFNETVTIEELYNLVPSVEWKDYIEKAFSHNTNFKIQRGHKIKIPSESLMTEMATLIETLSTRDQANLLIWRMFIQFANDFMHTGSEEDDIQKSHFNKIGSGSTRSDNCIAQIETFFPKAYNDMYIAHYLDKSTKINIKSLFEKLRKGFEQVIDENDWISKRTKIRAREKLAATKINVGELSPHTPEFQDLKERMSTTDYIGNVLAIGNYTWDTISKNINEEKELLPGKVTSNNAFYAWGYNEIEILTGLINHQFVREALSPGLPRALLFGGFVSTTLGHELVHGFDDEGKQYDKDGFRLNWWQKKDDDIYSMKTECMSNQYANFNITYNGQMYQIPRKYPQGENIADNGGVKAAYRSYLKLPAQEKKCMPDLPFTSDQLFWLGHGFAWCTDSGTADYENLLSSNPSVWGHYPEPWRVNAVLANQPEFAADFNCPVGSPMNPQPEDRCIIW